MSEDTPMPPMKRCDDCNTKTARLKGGLCPDCGSWEPHPEWPPETHPE